MSGFLVIAALVIVFGGVAALVLAKRGSDGSSQVDRSQVAGKMDAFTVQEPWRRYVQGAQKSRRKFDEVVSSAKDGPTKDRLFDTGRQLDDIVARVWEVAQEGHLLSIAVKTADVASLERKLAAAEEEAASATTDRQPEAESSLASVRSSLEAAQRVTTQRDSAASRLQALDNRLDELVVRATEVATLGVEAAGVDQLRADLDSMVVDLEGLRQGIEETRRVATA